MPKRVVPRHMTDQPPVRPRIRFQQERNVVGYQTFRTNRYQGSEWVLCDEPRQHIAAFCGKLSWQIHDGSPFHATRSRAELSHSPTELLSWHVYEDYVHLSGRLPPRATKICVMPDEVQP